MDQDLVGAAIGRDIAGCWRDLLAPQREGASGCPANVRLIGEKRARRGHNPGTIGSRPAGVRAHAANSTDGGSSTARAADNTCAGTHASATGSTNIDGGNTTSARAHAAACTEGSRAGDAASITGRGPATCATADSTSSIDGSATIIHLTGTIAG
jgi:hypothetical protein